VKKLTLTLMVALATACGGTTPEPRNADMTLAEAAASTVVVVVRNNWIPASTVQIFAEQLGSRPRLLGTVQANETSTFTVAARDVARGFMIRAERRAGEVLQSRRINETGGWMHTWNMAANIVLSEQLP